MGRSMLRPYKSEPKQKQENQTQEKRTQDPHAKAACGGTRQPKSGLEN
jgi:hypothetical protein